MRYPKYIYSTNETITRRNMEEYDRRQTAIYEKCLEIAPDYHKRNLREQIGFNEQAAAILGYTP